MIMSQKNIENRLLLNGIIKENFRDFSSFSGIDFSSFSFGLNLTDYQQEALKYAIASLKLYYKNIGNEKLIYKYNRDLPSENWLGEHQINRASFWMATGSGKTIVMIKLIEILHLLQESGKIGKKPIMLLVPNDKILNQFKQRIQDYNQYHSTTMRISELREYESNILDLYPNEINVFLGRSNLLDVEENVGKKSDAKRLNYRNFLHPNGWYILLDEAHRGDSKDSIRKEYINQLARGLRSERIEYDEVEKKRGFIFNFSATFSDELDLQTCAFNYNLEKFNNDGYGKNIAILDEKLRFKENENDEEKINRVIESFIIFGTIKKSKKILFEKYSFQSSKPLLYHNPLMISVSDEVNTPKAGIKLYFEALLRVMGTKVENFESIKSQMLEKLKSQKTYFSSENLSSEFLEILRQITLDEIRESVFHSREISTCEACRIKGNAKELVFKSKNADKPFLLLNIGDTKKWEKDYIASLGIELSEDLSQSFFENINDKDSPINIMMGSQVFKEGWDSNRVNFINFINIGSAEAKKYVLQTIGRGVRIEPYKNMRKRLAKSDLEYGEREKIKGWGSGLETLFVMATHHGAIKAIVERIQDLRTQTPLKGIQKSKTFSPLLVPKYQEVDGNRSYKISAKDFEELKGFLQSFDEDVLLLSEEVKSVDMGYSTIQKVLQEDESIQKTGGKQDKSAEELFRAIDTFFVCKQKDLKEFRELEDEICHFEKFTSTLDPRTIEGINKGIEKLLRSGNKDVLIEQEKEKLKNNVIDIDTYTQNIREIENENFDDKFKNEEYGYTFSKELKEHYYLPIIIADSPQNNEISYVIRHWSEKEFLEDLKNYLRDDNHALKKYNWSFSRIVENVDEIFIPYLDSTTQTERMFFPDFIFWLQDKESRRYKILFVDPKGLEHESGARDKAMGFEEIFRRREFEYRGQKVGVELVFYNKGSKDKPKLEEYIKGSMREIFG